VSATKTDASDATATPLGPESWADDAAPPSPPNPVVAEPAKAEIVGPELVVVVLPGKVKPLGSEPVPPSGLLTVTVTAPETPGGVVQVIVVPFASETPVAAVEPKLTVHELWKFVPVIVTAAPDEPDEGETDVTVGLVTPTE